MLLISCRAPSSSSSQEIFGMRYSKASPWLVLTLLLQLLCLMPVMHSRFQPPFLFSMPSKLSQSTLSPPVPPGNLFSLSGALVSAGNSHLSSSGTSGCWQDHSIAPDQVLLSASGCVGPKCNPVFVLTPCNFGFLLGNLWGSSAF